MKRVALCLIAFLFPLIVAAQTAQPPAPEATDVILTVEGEVAHAPLKLRASDLAKLPRRAIQARDHDGRQTTFEGVPLVEVLRLAGVTLGEKLRGRNLATYLLVEAADGYRVVFALPELDPAFTDRTILLAMRRDGKSLSDAEGPLRIVVPDEKRQGRWVRQVMKLSILRVPNEAAEKPEKR